MAVMAMHFAATIVGGCASSEPVPEVNSWVWFPALVGMA